MTPNCIFDIIFSSSALLKTQIAYNEKIINYRTLSELHFKETRIKNISIKENLKKK